MGTSIKIFMKDGKVKNFPHVGRHGGSYTKSIKYQGSFAIVVDEDYNETAIPVDLISEIKVTHDRW